MAAREDILTAIRGRHPAPVELPHVPDFRQAPGDLVSAFTAALKRLDGKTVTQPPADLQQWLSETFPGATRICSAVPGMIFSMPTEQIRSFGTFPHRSALPSLVTVTTAPVCATAKLAPVIPASASRISGRVCSRMTLAR